VRRGERGVDAIEQRGLVARQEGRHPSRAQLQDALHEGAELVGGHLVDGPKQLLGGHAR